nr:ammonia-forming cytochrome c nitrite reductase subunit c552 [uncultured Carboxylicivirga sp.]
MKELKKLMYLFIAVLAALTISCTKEGPAGADGENGENGMDGSNGTAGCVQCHVNNENMVLKGAMWEHSGHAEGTSWVRGTSSSCAQCHSSQGFQEYVLTGTVENAPSMPLPANCYTCHQIHETYTSEDWTLRNHTGVDFIQGGLNYEANNANANTCITCHQSRPVDTIDPSSSDLYTITSYRFGPHHGPQGNMIAGAGISGAVELGSNTYVNSTHATSGDCITCHMAEGDFEIGGHTNHVSTGEWGDDKVVNSAGCVACHEDMTSDALMTDYVESARNSNMVLLEELHDKLFELKYIDASGYVLGNDGVNRASSSNPLTVSHEIAGAIYNYKFVEEDLSMMIHNPKYARMLVNESLAVLQ